MMITAAVLAEICSALPISGSIYIWAAASAGPKYARFFGFLVAWWSCAGWMSSIAALYQVRPTSGGFGVPHTSLTSCSRAQVTSFYAASQLAVWEIDFPGGARNDNIKWRAFIWAISEGFLLLAIAINYLPPRSYSFIVKVALAICFIDFFLCIIWLPIGVSRTYGFRTAKEVFTSTCQRFPGLHFTGLTL
jgi:translation initiation factor 5B